MNKQKKLKQLEFTDPCHISESGDSHIAKVVFHPPANTYNSHLLTINHSVYL